NFLKSLGTIEMNRWFEAKNFGNYAKTALIQAQKKIDQVLDIKEDEILSQSGENSKSVSDVLPPSQSQSSLAPIPSTFFLKSSSNSSIPSKEDDEFFSSFLNQKKEPTFDNSFLSTSSNEISSSQTLHKSSHDEESVTESMSSSVGTVHDESKPNKKSKKKPTPESIEKQNWIQSFVDSSESPNSIKTDDPKTEAEKNESDKKEEQVQETDYIKVDEGSGNASSNEEGLDTCASSDIEVISLPSTSGENSIQRIPSLASMAKQAKAKNVKHIFVKSPPPPNSSLTKSDNSNEPKLDVPSDRSILVAREAHIIKLNQQNVKLQEENDNLQNEIDRLRYETNEKIQVLQRSLNEVNVKYQEANSERDLLKKDSNGLHKEYIELKNMITEKDEQIKQFIEEGKKLSKQELCHMNIIKKLRAKEKESEEIISILKSDYQKVQKELEELKTVLDGKEELEAKNVDLLKKLEKTAIALEKELNSSKQNLEDSEEKCKGLENNLQNAYKELAELHKKIASKENSLSEATSSIESQLKEEIQLAVEKERITSQKSQEALRWELDNIRQDFSRTEQQHMVREEMLRKEISDLQQQLRDSEMRNNDLSQNISNATKPLLRQIENLQASHSNQIELLESAEKSLIERLRDSQANLCDVSEKNRQNQELVLDLTHQTKALEAQIQTLKSEKSRINTEYQLCKTNLERFENEKLEKEAETKATLISLNQQVETLTKEKKYLERELEIEKDKFENENKKLKTLVNEYTKEKEILVQQVNQQNHDSSLPNSSPSPSKLIESKSANMFHSFQNTNGAINILETLQSKLKQKEGEIIQLQKEIADLERVRESMAKEMVNLSNKLEILQDQTKEYPQLQDNYDKLAVEYNALLTMFGEKTEENEELKLDLQDVKEMYRLQIEDLLKRSSL
ncbi:TATA element modulatory factor isoform X1, partial [Brachionus plicatilis]